MITEETARKQLETLYQEGKTFAKAFDEEQETEDFEEGYQRWYSRALLSMKRLAPDRYAEFQRFYRRDAKISVHWSRDHVVQDVIWGVEDEDHDLWQEAGRCFRSQLAILKSVSDRLAWSALDTEDQVERGLQLELLETARDLLGVDARAAGVLAGKVLEIYLRKLAAKHKLRFRKDRPPIREIVDALRGADVLDISVHSQAVWLAEIEQRSRAEGEAPTKLQVRDLIDGSRWLITHVF